MASYYDNSILSEKDLERIKQLGLLWSQTDDKAKKQQYHDAAEAIRLGYGYSGGGDGHGYTINQQDVVTSAMAAKNYTNALRDAQKQSDEQYASLEQRVQADGDERLRQAYIKNMQQSLGIDQALRAQGLTGGVTESTRAALGNSYLGLRDDIMKDVTDQKTELDSSAMKMRVAYDADVAKAELEAANQRTSQMSAAEQREYDRLLDEYNKNYQKQQDEYKRKQDEYQREWEKLLFEYQKAKDEADRKYQQEQDAYERQYREQQDAYNRQLEQQKLAVQRAAAAKKSSSSSSSSAAQKAAEKAAKEEKEKLDELKKNAWKMLENGVYSDEFPELLGYSEAELMLYMNNVMSGY